MHQAKKKGIANGTVTDRIVVGCRLDIGIGIGKEIGERITTLKEDPGERHGRKKNTPISGRGCHESDPMKIVIYSRITGAFHFNGLLANLPY
jgi:hypothetical protein